MTVPDPPASLKPVRAHHGRQAITAAVAAVTEVTRTEHAIVGEVYGAGAREGCAVGRVTCIAHHWTQRPDGVSDLVWHLRYDDQYELGEDGWRISVRALTINAIETRSARRLLPREPG
ncbi:hypothetical protein Mkiyose1665_05740 [Mycobacterium kiyosense]|uniref:SnoaL-like domain-containing protein n=1 Tax=Mycobacterium kiyosense TaxID=2871094 RepID=A0A9P3Q3W1_9MYCO|nr:hypothetical protein IWGMT90018_30640 [Mycobacterium kiyosense]BDE14123.1 hypothetical protein MKCMC460_29830 [Mycobacterium sp. 20KCMC460]GLB82956.1 hypothetical protein SRL2020028_22120 [Mycobacterium kiyosense]GLB89203.1 hypothetical protein SRL2020130_20200 [Mycobacterium kiyosense]GLB93854.1 hypothetical protein SRL2020226_06300 [Mycobacterium kiyosense]